MSNSIAPGSSADVNVRVTALTTNPNVPVTYKTIILKKNLVNGVNTLTQEMMSAINTKYVIKYDYVLGENITVPSGCVLEFDGGSIGGVYILEGNNTKIKAQNVAILKNGVIIGGSWCCPRITSIWFNDITETNRIKQLFNLSSSSCWNDIYIDNGTYNVSATQEKEGIIIPKDNTNIYLNGTIQLEGNSLSECYIFHITSSNIKIVGGSIIGDKLTHTGSLSSEYGHGIYLDNSKNVYIDSVEISNCFGDSIDISSEDRYNGVNKNVIINNCHLHDSRRQGITLSHVENIKISNCYIHDITEIAPKSCIDIEPNDDMYVKNVLIEGCTFDNGEEERAILLQTYSSLRSITNVIINNNTFEHSVRHIHAVCGDSSYAGNIDGLKITNNIFKNCYYNQQFHFNRIANLNISNNKFYPKNNTESNSNNIIDLSSIVDNSVAEFSYNFVNLVGYLNLVNFNNVNNNTIIGNSVVIYNNSNNNIVKADSLSSYGNVADSILEISNEINLFTYSIISNSFIKININNETVHSNGLVLRDNSSILDCIISINNVTAPILLRTTFGRLERNNITITGNTPEVAVRGHDYLTVGIIRDNKFAGTTNSGRFVDNISKFIIDNVNKKYGDSSVRQSLVDVNIGDSFFDITSGIEKPIWYKGNGVWVDATGATV